MKPVYFIIGREDSQELARVVNQNIQAGAELVGGVSVSSHFESVETQDGLKSTTYYTFAQAMIKR